jgi:glycosyltransferase involved in cell wall biosynthesis
MPDGAICNSRYTAATLPRIYSQPRQTRKLPCEVVYYPVAPPSGISPAERAAARGELGAAPGAAVVIQVSRMEEWKGHRLHLDALARLSRMPAHAEWTCWIVGGAQQPREERYLEALRAAAAALGIGPRVKFLGQRRDVARLLAAADIHCQPNTGPEPFGIAFIEALYASLPVVTTAIGGALEIVDDSCGILVAPNDPDALAAALRGLVDDPELRARLGAGGPARAAALCDPVKQMARLAESLTKIVTRDRKLARNSLGSA